ncbi:hypothetical protein LWP59_28075 [Amycolatopsis acidiphila]|uniref:hypothetical protein n=1 Tax=Amycolatopsis acidiphila TaxID=715473 RepID=UPI001E480D73|nr:hypothetical protein [Amycolatopsis acidiphila]UIJ64214.1 hypothetical protein LWP59_28075 [Amycolatopsis acidiphila]
MRTATAGSMVPMSWARTSGARFSCGTRASASVNEACSEPRSFSWRAQPGVFARKASQPGPLSVVPSLPSNSNGRLSPLSATGIRLPSSRLRVPSRSAPAVILGSAAMAAAAVVPPAECPNMPTPARFSVPARPGGTSVPSASGSPPASSNASWSSTKLVSATRTATAFLVKALGSPGGTIVASEPSGNWTSGDS